MTLGKKQSHVVAYASLSPAEVEATLPIVEGLVEDRLAVESDYTNERVEGEALIGVLVTSRCIHKDLELTGPDAEEIAKLVFTGMYNVVAGAVVPTPEEYHPHLLHAA